MKLLRVGDKGKEIPAIVDSENNYRDLSSLISDLNPINLNFTEIVYNDNYYEPLSMESKSTKYYLINDSGDLKQIHFN